MSASHRMSVCIFQRGEYRREIDDGDTIPCQSTQLTDDEQLARMFTKLSIVAALLPYERGGVSVGGCMVAGGRGWAGRANGVCSWHQC